jgi:glycosyltransferase involved in cell wall biosynthesis
MNILVDYQIFINQKIGGVSRYHATINQYINEMGGSDSSRIISLGHKNIYIPSQGSILNLLNRRGTRKLLVSLNQAYTLSKISKYDVFHPTFYDTYFLKSKSKPPVVITIHDLIPEIYFKDKMNWMIDQKKKILSSAAGIIAISEATRTELINRYKLNENIVHTIHHGYPEHFEKYARDENLLKHRTENQRPYLLFVGTRDDYKNFKPFIRQIANFLIKYNFHLKVTGNKPTETEIALFRELKITEHIVFTGQVDDKELFMLYNQAFCFIFPSLLEGFGMPLLESFIAKCPVICSDIPVFREICGNAAAYFNTGEQESISASLETFLENNDYRTQMIDRGLEQVRKFQWRESAKKTLEIYKSLQ